MPSPDSRARLKNIARAPRVVARRTATFLRERAGVAQQLYGKQLQERLIAFRQVADRRLAQRAKEHLALGYRVLDKLERSGVAVVVLGEFAAAHSVAQTPETRLPSVLDLLLTPEDRLLAKRELVRFGFLFSEPDRSRHPRGLEVWVREAFLPGPHTELGDTLVRRHAKSVRFGGVPVRIPSPTHQLLYVCCVNRTSSAPDSGSPTAAQIQQLTTSGKVDWRMALRHAESLGVLTVFCRALTDSGVGPLLAHVDPLLLRRIERAAGATWQATEPPRESLASASLAQDLVDTLRTLVSQELSRLSSSVEGTLRAEIHGGVRATERIARRALAPAATWVQRALRRARPARS